ncbi:hypothetical protein SMALB_6181 [Streptomyces malaysiensis]|uniref:Uncharacterized protein n=1 Tax=Streptomyces malaysiensis TaxID=92644 RepID=A0A7X5X7K3_STRMQ|nr:hypothetical protein [Streptomyces malaysiensis]
MTGQWDEGGNLIVKTSDELPDDTPDKVTDKLADTLISENGTEFNGWAASFLVDTHSSAVNEAYATYVEDEGTKIIDNVHGVLVD